MPRSRWRSMPVCNCGHGGVLHEEACPYPGGGECTCPPITPTTDEVITAICVMIRDAAEKHRDPSDPYPTSGTYAAAAFAEELADDIANGEWRKHLRSAKATGQSAENAADHKATALVILDLLITRNRGAWRDIMNGQTIDDRALLIEQLALVIEHGGRPPNWVPVNRSCSDTSHDAKDR